MTASLSRARVLYGTTQGGGDPGTDTFTTVDNVLSIGGPDGQNGEIEVTNLLSVGKEYIPDLPDYGTISCSINRDYSSTAQNAIEGLFISGELRNFRIEALDRQDTVLRTYDFIGFVATFSNAEEQSAARSGEFSLRVNGAVTIS